MNEAAYNAILKRLGVPEEARARPPVLEQPAPWPDGAIVKVEDNTGHTRIALVCGVHEEPGSGTLHGGRWYLLSSREALSWTHESRVTLLTKKEPAR